MDSALSVEVVSISLQLFTGVVRLNFIMNRTEEC